MFHGGVSFIVIIFIVSCLIFYVYDVCSSKWAVENKEVFRNLLHCNLVKIGPKIRIFKR